MKKFAVMAAVLVMSLFMLANTAYADYYSDRIMLRYGMRGSSVTEMQRDLQNLGYFPHNATGYFGSLTRQAVISYQKANHLYADGIVGPWTAVKIKASRTVQTAGWYLGVPYVWGGVSPSGFDCSGLIHYTLLSNGIVVPRTAADQYNVGTWVSRSNLRPGDLVFFTTYKAGPSHVGIYIGSGQFVHASSGAGRVTVSSLSSSYYASRYIGARRVIY